MIIKNVKPTTTVETILKALDPFAYLDERNVRLVKAKPPGAKCFCFVDMDSHEVPKKMNERTLPLVVISCSISVWLQSLFTLSLQLSSTYHCVFFCSKWHVWLSSSPNPDPFILTGSEFMLRSPNPWRTKSKSQFCKNFLTCCLVEKSFHVFLMVFFLFQFQKRLW